MLVRTFKAHGGMECAVEGGGGGPLAFSLPLYGVCLHSGLPPLDGVCLHSCLPPLMPATYFEPPAVEVRVP